MIDQFRAIESRYAHKVGLLTSDDCRNVLRVWKGTNTRWRSPGSSLPTPPVTDEAWDLLWSTCPYQPLDAGSMAPLADAAGLSLQDTFVEFRRLYRARAIYPDGTLAYWAEPLLGIV